MKTKMKKIFEKGIIMAFIFAMVVAMVPCVEARAASMRIPSGAKMYKGHMYYVYTSDKNIEWNTAEDLCQAKGGHLVYITSAAENEFVTNLVVKRSKDAWIGIYYDTQNETYCLLNGKRASYTCFGENGYDGYYDYYYAFIDSDDRKWETRSRYSDSTMTNYVCEWDTSTATTLPDQVTIKSVSKASSGMAILTWNKMSGVKGYTVYMKEGKKGKYKKVNDTKSKSINSYVAQGLKKGKTYYFQVRAYKNIYGERSYGELSQEKKFKMR